jgi:hypothetical protein
LPTIRLFNEAPHRFPQKNHRRIITAARRFHTARVKCEEPNLSKSRPAFLRKQTAWRRAATSPTGRKATFFAGDEQLQLPDWFNRSPGGGYLELLSIEVFAHPKYGADLRNRAFLLLFKGLGSSQRRTL